MLLFINCNTSLFKLVSLSSSFTTKSKTAVNTVVLSRLKTSSTSVFHSSTSKKFRNKLLQCRASTSTTSLRRLPKINNTNDLDNIFKINGIENNLKKNLIIGGSSSIMEDKSSSSSSPKYLLNGSNSSSKDKSDMIVVLDMDECLIHSQFLTLENEKYRQKENRPMNAKTDFCDSFCITLPESEPEENNHFTKSKTMVHVNKRPNLESFLKKVTSKYQTYIFTAAMQVYANPVLNIILEEEYDNDRNNNSNNATQQQNRFYRDSCIYDPNLGAYVKDLNHVLKKQKLLNNHQSVLNRAVLIDNNPLSFLANPSNGILVSSFYDDPNDDTLPAVWELLEELDTLDDVRPALQHLFGLEDALNDIISPSSSLGEH